MLCLRGKAGLYPGPYSGPASELRLVRATRRKGVLRPRQCRPRRRCGRSGRSPSGAARGCGWTQAKDARLDVPQPALAPCVIEKERSVFRADFALFAPSDRVRHEVRRLVTAQPQVLLRARQLFDESRQDVLPRIRAFGRGDEQSADECEIRHGSCCASLTAATQAERSVG